MAKIRNITLSGCTPEFGSTETLIYCIEHWNAIITTIVAKNNMNLKLRKDSKTEGQLPQFVISNTCLLQRAIVITCKK